MLDIVLMFDLSHLGFSAWETLEVTLKGTIDQCPEALEVVQSLLNTAVGPMSLDTMVAQSCVDAGSIAGGI